MSHKLSKKCHTNCHILSHKLSNIVTQIVKFCQVRLRIRIRHKFYYSVSVFLLCIVALICLHTFHRMCQITLGLYCCPTKIAVASKRAFQRRPLMDTSVLWNGRVPFIFKFNTMNLTTWECLYLLLAIHILSKQGRIFLFEIMFFFILFNQSSGLILVFFPLWLLFQCWTNHSFYLPKMTPVSYSAGVSHLLSNNSQWTRISFGICN